MKQKIGVAVGGKVMVRLALLAGMPEDDPNDEELSNVRLARTDPAAMDSLRKEWVGGGKNKAPARVLTSAEMSDRIFLYPRRREAHIDYVDVHDGNIKSINVTVKTVGSTVLQPAVGHYPEWAMQEFRLAGVPLYDEEPDDVQDQHVAYPVPEEEA